MATSIIMPKAGMAMEEGTIVKWLVAEGEKVEQGEPLLEILTDKVNMEIEAQVSGTLLKILSREGEVVPVIQVIGYIGEPGEIPEENTGPAAVEMTGVARALEGGPGDAPVAAAVPGAASAAVANIPIAAPAASTVDAPAVQGFMGKIAATPSARRLAKEKHIDLSKVKATGSHGEIKAEDILAYKGVVISPLARRAAEANGIDPSTITGSGYGGKVVMQDVASILSQGGQAPAAAGALAGGVPAATAAAVPAAGRPASIGITADGKEIAEEIPYKGVRKVIGDKMVESKFTAPHVYFTQRVDAEKLLALRSQVNEAQEKKTSVNDYVLKAAVIALQKYPELNSSLIGDKILKYANVNIGLAVAAPNGLIVPVVKNADRMSVVEISKEAGALAEKARNGKLTPDEYTGGTFTVSNLGMFGIVNFTAIINPPEAGILAVSAASDEPVVVKDANGNKTIAIKPMMNITLTVDHRIVDGLLAAQFVTEVKRLLEHPIELFI
ncbi:MAG TPA: 2-oxo acid dehydrogenase subunit E2 [Anaerovoracaceae bacterium]|nr:2-oxo acid dehydrogenase subunit E2 [Anaerovoracaceae bacterium]